jgi:acyl carrier protein
MMHDKELFLSIVEKVFKNYKNKILINSLPSDIEDWDSIGHLNLVLVIEKSYNIKIDFEESIMISDLSDLYELIESKLK